MFTTLAKTFAVLYACSFGSLTAHQPCPSPTDPQELVETNMDTTERSVFDRFCDLMGLEETTLTDNEKKGLSTQQLAFELCLKDSLQTKRSLDLYLKIATISSIFLTAISTLFVIRDVKSRRDNR